MGRSVSTPYKAAFVLHSVLPDDFDSDAWREDCECFAECVQERFPSMYAIDWRSPDAWVGREDRALCENSFAYIGISEYCGLVALWILPKDPKWYANAGWEALRDHWIDSVRGSFERIADGWFGRPCRHVATASNGESFYEYKEA